MRKGVFALLASYLVFDLLSRWTFLGGFVIGGLCGGGIGYWLA